MSAALEVSDLSGSYGQGNVLYNMNFTVEQGGITALLGANGAGKTTTLRAIYNLLPQRTGDVRLFGSSTERKPTEAVARMGVGHVPDGRGTFDSLTVEENLILGAYGRRDKSAVRDDMKRMFGYFPRLQERFTQQAGTLSGGEQQMLAIARALIGRPKLLILDEPSFGLAPVVVQEIFSIIRLINTQEGVAVLLVEQNAGMAFALADQAFVMETGRIVVSGKSADVAANEEVRRAYLGI